MLITAQKGMVTRCRGVRAPAVDRDGTQAEGGSTKPASSAAAHVPDDFPELGTNLVTTLPTLDVYNLSHFSGYTI
jgi:hypothetical protein